MSKCKIQIFNLEQKVKLSEDIENNNNLKKKKSSAKILHLSQQAIYIAEG